VNEREDWRMTKIRREQQRGWEKEKYEEEKDRLFCFASHFASPSPVSHKFS